MTMLTIRQTAALLRSFDNILLLTHLRPDGDTVGSAAALCAGCGRCAESCPRQVIQIQGGKASIDLKNCISCFCCQEMCPVKAIGAKRVFFG